MRQLRGSGLTSIRQAGWTAAPVRDHALHHAALDAEDAAGTGII